MIEIKYRAWNKKKKRMVSWEKIQGRFQGVWWSHINNGNYILLEYSG